MFEGLIRRLRLDTGEGRGRMMGLFTIVSTAMLVLGFAIILYLLFK